MSFKNLNKKRTSIYSIKNLIHKGSLLFPNFLQIRETFGAVFPLNTVELVINNLIFVTPSEISLNFQ